MLRGGARVNAFWVWPAGLGLLGLIFGSFIATVAIRWPAGRRVSAGRSECDACGKTLGARELVPVLSYSVQRRKCRECGARISAWHPVIELLGLAVGAIAGWLQPGWIGAAFALFGWQLLALGALDLRAYWLPNLLTAALGVTGVAAMLFLYDAFPGQLLIDGLIGYAVLEFVRLLYRAIRKRDGLGAGDPKLFAGISIWLGWTMLPAILLLACVIGLCAVAGRRIAGANIAATDKLPLGTLLAAAAFIGWVAMELRPLI